MAMSTVDVVAVDHRWQEPNQEPASAQVADECSAKDQDSTSRSRSSFRASADQPPVATDEIVEASGRRNKEEAMPPCPSEDGRNGQIEDKEGKLPKAVQPKQPGSFRAFDPLNQRARSIGDGENKTPARQCPEGHAEHIPVESVKRL